MRKDSIHFFGFTLALTILLVFRKESRTDVTRKDLYRNLTLPLLIVAIMKIPKEIQIFVVKSSDNTYNLCHARFNKIGLSLSGRTMLFRPHSYRHM